MISILIIEDHEDLLRILGAGLSHLGYRVETAVSGREGIRKLETAAFDMVITDYLMADMNGDAILQYVRARIVPLIPVICITGTPWLPTAEAFDGVLLKPFTLEALVALVETLI